MPATHANRLKCRYCQKQVHPAEASGDERRGYQCIRCYDWHQHALEVLGGATPLGCQGCGDTWEQLKERTPGVEVRMYVVPKDGIYQLLCKRCCDAYVPMRKDLFGGTEFGARINL